MLLKGDMFDSLEEKQQKRQWMIHCRLSQRSSWNLMVVYFLVNGFPFPTGTGIISLCLPLPLCTPQYKPGLLVFKPNLRLTSRSWAAFCVKSCLLYYFVYQIWSLTGQIGLDKYLAGIDCPDGIIKECRKISQPLRIGKRPALWTMLLVLEPFFPWQSPQPQWKTRCLHEAEKQTLGKKDNNDFEIALVNWK